jgi:hypothetical protein
MRISAINTTNFNGIYKVKASKKENENNRVEGFLSENYNVLKVSMPFEENGRTYFYAITKDSTEEEKHFENDMKKNQIPYWKAAPFVHIANKALIDKIFETDKILQGKESWTIPQSNIH